MLALPLLASSCHKEQAGTAPAEAVDTLGVLLSNIQQCSRLYTTEYRVHKVVACESNREVGALGISIGLNVFGQRKVVIPMEATLKGYVDLGLMTADNIERQGRQITVTLPDPQVMLTATRIDHEGIKHYVTGFRDDFTDRELALLEAEGREAIINDVPRMGIERAARASAVRLLIPIFEQMGFAQEDITISFRRDFNPFDIKDSLWKKTTNDF
ncbi:MAG: DUF4230 domain-containing protein [Prevotella sp.]|nr:DUF4230 domain-containing protein [Prevotella sp.]